MAQGAPGAFVSRSLAANVTEVAASEAINVGDLDNITMHAVQRVDNGTVVLAIEHSLDNALWVTVGATIAETDFAVGDDAVIERTLSDSNGMAIRTGWVRINVTTHTGTGEYGLVIGGRRITNIV